MKLIFLFFIGIVGAQDDNADVNSYCIGENDYCLKSVVKLNDGNIEFTVLSSKQGWAAFGIGSSMMDSDIYGKYIMNNILVGWVNSMGDPVVSRRKSSGYVLPGFNPSSNFNTTKLSAEETRPWVKLGFKVTRPIASDNTITSESRFIFAHSDSKPDNLNDPRSAFPFHQNNKGLLDPFNFLGNGGKYIANESKKRAILIAHGILFFIAWGVAPFVGIFVARYLKNAMGVWWYRVHLGIFVGITGVLSLISFFLIYSQKQSHFNDNHQKIGLAIFILMFFQFALGYTCNALWDPKRSAVPWWDVLHWYFGRSLVLLAVINIFLGLLEYAEYTGNQVPLENTQILRYMPIFAAYWVWIGIMFSIMIFGHFYFGVSRHIEKHSEEVK